MNRKRKIQKVSCQLLLNKAHMSIYRKAKKILDNNNVTIEATTGNAVYFDVKVKDKVYNVFYLIRLNKWNCNCRWFSLKVKNCSHIIACKSFIQNRRIL